VFFLLAAAVTLSGCASAPRPAIQADNAGTPGLPPYTGPRARISVTGFDVKATKAGASVSAGLREMLVNALVNSNRFRVTQPQNPPADAKEERPDLLITVSVVEFEPQASGGAAGVGGGGGVGSGILGGLLGSTLNKAHMGMDIRIIDASTSAVLAQTRVQGQASDMAGGFMAGFFGGWQLAPGLAAYANTPMEKAIRICTIEAVRYVWQTIPASYFKY
jgi:curli biogenesis system outer membrane secretion channel CsgG